MKTSILEKFAYGNIDPTLGETRKNKQYKSIIQEANGYETKLLALLDESAQELYNKIIDAQSKAHLIAITDKFIYGYRLGVLMTMEVFNGKDDAIFGAEV